MPDSRHWYWEVVVKDWLVDTEPLQEITRAFWWDALCRMWLLDRCGQLSGTVAELARLCRTTSNNARAAIADLQKYSTADIDINGEPGNEVVTLVNRRMRREYLDRKSARDRKMRQRGGAGHRNVPADVTPMSQRDTNTKPHPQPKDLEPSPLSAQSPREQTISRVLVAAGLETTIAYNSPAYKHLGELIGQWGEDVVTSAGMKAARKGAYGDKAISYITSVCIGQKMKNQPAPNGQPTLTPSQQRRRAVLEARLQK